MTPQLRAARELADKIKQRKVGADGFFSCRDVYLKGWSGLDSPEAVKLAAEVLQDAGWLRERVRRIRTIRRATVQSLRSESEGVGMSTQPANPTTAKPLDGLEAEGANLGRSAGERTYKTIKTWFCRFCRRLFRRISRD